MRVLTWLGEPRGARVERHYLVFRESAPIGPVAVEGRLVQTADMPSDDGLVVRATTEWVFASDGGRPRRIPGEVATLFRSSPSQNQVSKTGGG